MTEISTNVAKCGITSATAGYFMVNAVGDVPLRFRTGTKQIDETVTVLLPNWFVRSAMFPGRTAENIGERSSLFYWVRLLQKQQRKKSTIVW